MNQDIAGGFRKTVNLAQAPLNRHHADLNMGQARGDARLILTGGITGNASQRASGLYQQVGVIGV
jgi:hypothetical protein